MASLDVMLRTLLISIPIVALLVVSLAAFIRTRHLSALLSTIGASCLVVVVLTHAAEALRLLPGMRWGQPDSAGHYVDLTSALAGVALLSAALVLRTLDRQTKTNFS
jgi:apolipoprotein N-acyltransferase